MTDLKNGKAIFSEFVRNNFPNASALSEKFDILTKLYFEVNSVINISAIREENDVYIKHYLDSIYPYRYFFGSCCDVGCGGGFPCLPLAIVTGLNYIGIDGVGKKLALINRCKTALGLENITAEHFRSEDLIKTNKTFDCVCARAVADTDKVFGFCSPLVASHGRLILYKTQNDVAVKLSVLKKTDFILTDTVDYELPNTDIKRRLFIYDKKN